MCDGAQMLTSVGSLWRGRKTIRNVESIKRKYVGTVDVNSPLLLVQRDTA